MRKIITNIIDSDYKINNILHTVSSQLSDGYWENDEWNNEFWNWLNFSTTDSKNEKKRFLVVTVRNNAIWKGVKDIFSNKSDEEIIHYIGNILDDCYEEASCVFNHYDTQFIQDTINTLTKYVHNNSSKNTSKTFFDWQTGKPKCAKDKFYLCVVNGSYSIFEFIDGLFFDSQFDESYEINEIEKWVELP